MYNLYNVYKDDKLILANARAPEVTKLTGCKRNSVASYANKGDRIKGIYGVVVVNQIETEKLYRNDAEEAFARRYGISALRQWLAMNRKYGGIKR